MMLKNENDVIACIREDQWMMDVLTHVKALNLPDWWVCAGFVRSKIWDVIHNFSERTDLPDVDVIYYNTRNISIEKEKELERQLGIRDPRVPWSVKNQARMHLVNDVPPYKSSEDAMSKYPETATALGVKIDAGGKVLLAAPWGVTDAINGLVEPTPYFNQSEERLHIYRDRVRKKQWHLTWKTLKVAQLEQ